MPPFDYYYKIAGEDTVERHAAKPADERALSPGASWPADFVTVDTRHRRRPPGAGLRRGRLTTCCWPSRLDSSTGDGPGVDLRRRPRRHVHRRGARLSRPLGQGGRQGHHPRAAAPRAALPPGAISPRLSVLLAGRRRPADPVSAQELVHPHHAVQGRRCWPTTAQINWLPEHIRDGRFGNFLETNVDWALSRERYWGTPLPIWVCENDRLHGGRGQLCRAAGQARRAGHRSLGRRQAGQSRACPTICKVHKPYIDAVTYDSPNAAGKRMRRVPEVIDCWFDSGAMPFAQWGYPHQRARRAVRRAVSGRLHQRGDRSDARLVLQPAGDQHAAVRSSAEDRPHASGHGDKPADAPRRPRPIRIRSAIASCWG